MYDSYSRLYCAHAHPIMALSITGSPSNLVTVADLEHIENTYCTLALHHSKSCPLDRSDYHLPLEQSQDHSYIVMEPSPRPVGLMVTWPFATVRSGHCLLDTNKHNTIHAHLACSTSAALIYNILLENNTGL